MLTLTSERPDVKQQTSEQQPPKPQEESRQVRRARIRVLEKAQRTRHRQDTHAFRQQVDQAARRAAEREMHGSMEAQVEYILGRKNGERRNRKDTTVVEEQCNQCGTHRRVSFYRKGRYDRHLDTLHGRLNLRVPRVRCLCGGDVSIVWGCFLPYERRFVDVTEEMLLLSGLCLSLREIRLVLDAKGQRLSIATICKEIHSVVAVVEADFLAALERVPPVIQLDGIFVRVAEETGETFTDKRNRRRKRKKVRKRPLLVAWGIYPETGERVLLDWVEGTEEDKESWLRLLERLDRRGICAATGLRLFIHDGSSGLEAAFEAITFGQVEHQRCIFHKMRNVLDAVRGEPGMTRDQKQERRMAVLEDLVKVWKADTAEEAERRRDAFATAWQEKEPVAVERLRNGFDATIVYFQVQAQARTEGREWERRFLRTTSSLERQNRAIRQKARAAGVFQSSSGLRSNVYLADRCRGKGEASAEEIRQRIRKVADEAHAQPRQPKIPCP